MKFLIRAVLFLGIGVLLSVHASACTVFVLDDGGQYYYGSNYDWHLGVGYVMVNPRGLHKQGWVVAEDPGETVRWKSRYGSVTFVQYGRGLPKGGMNEAGLVIEGLLLFETEYPPADQRPYIGSSAQFKQYMLDTCATVAEVVAAAGRVRLSSGYTWAPGVHFMVADRTGDCAVLEYLQGRLKVHRGRQLPVKVLTNHAYTGRAAAPSPMPVAEFGYSGSSAGRFGLAAQRVADYASSSGQDGVDYAMDTLSKVAAGDATQWQQVYDQTKGVVYWRTRNQRSIRWVDLKKIDFSCHRIIRALPVQAPIAGEANTHLMPFPVDANRRLVRQAMSLSRDAIPVPEALWEEIAAWPGRESCNAP